MNLGRIHSNAEVATKIAALIGDCREIRDINKMQRSNPRYVNTNIDYKIDSMYALAMELEREIKPIKNLEGDDV